MRNALTMKPHNPDEIISESLKANIVDDIDFRKFVFDRHVRKSKKSAYFSKSL
jgi:hypothetical protein